MYSDDDDRGADYAAGGTTFVVFAETSHPSELHLIGDLDELYSSLGAEGLQWHRQLTVTSPG